MVPLQTIRRGIDAVHDRRIAGLSDADDAAVADAKVAFDDPDHRIDDDDVAQQEIQRALGAGDAGHADPVAQGLAAAVQAFVAVNGVILLDDRHQLGVAEPNEVALGRAVNRRVIAAVDRRHYRSPKSAFLRPFERRRRAHAGSELDPLVRSFRPVNSPRPPRVTSVLPSTPRLEAHRGACRNIEPHAESGGAIELHAPC